MEKYIGEEFDAIVDSVTSFGLFVMPENTCEGLIPLSTLGSGYIYDENNLTVRTSKDIIRVGDPIRIRLEEADMTRGKLRFSLLEEDDER